MKKILALLIISIFTGTHSFAQTDSTSNYTVAVQNKTQQVSTPTPVKEEPVYKLKPAVDIPITAIGSGWSGYAFTKIYSKDPSTPEQIANLNKNDINGFDRWGADVYSKKRRT